MSAPASASVDRPWASAGEVTDLVARFGDASLPQEEWTHRAHLTMALWFASHHSPAEALDLMRAGILRLNLAHGVPNTPTRGYHETITRFYMRVVTHHLREQGAWSVPTPGNPTPGDSISADRTRVDWAERANRLFAHVGARDLPLRHYSEARLKSPEARAGWMEPDIKHLP